MHTSLIEGNKCFPLSLNKVLDQQVFSKFCNLLAKALDMFVSLLETIQNKGAHIFVLMGRK